MSAFVHKLRKLGAMSPRELNHRIREKGRSEMERLGLDHVVPELPGENEFRTYLEQEAAHRFYRGTRGCRRQFVNRNFPDWIEQTLHQADRLCRHEFDLLNFGSIQLGDSIDWHRDPVTGQVWERRFWADYSLENDTAGRDAKTIHELNRHQHLPRLAKSYRLIGREHYAEEAIAQIESWIEQNPPGIGVNWHSSLEIGIRAISWMWTLFLILPSRSLTDDSARRIGCSLFAQLEHVYRHTSLFSSPNTHLIGEAAALFIGGVVFGDLKRPAAWRARGAELLAAEAEKQILDDGVYGELSSYYHCYALDFYLQALVLARQNRFEFTHPRTQINRRDFMERRVCAMLEFLMHIARPDGTIPRLGDDDGGRALALARTDYRSFDDALCLGATLFSRGDFKQQAERFAEETLWLLGENAWETFESLEPRPPAECSAVFRDAGYSTQRSGWGPQDSHLVFDLGGLGMLTGGHSHADSLSVTLFAHGKDLLVDPGTFVYNGAPEWRDYFRSTRAHNTVVIDGCDQAEAGGTFRWNTRMQPRLSAESRATVEYLEAQHDGYARLESGVIHQRRLLRVPGKYWVLADDLIGTGNHTYDFWFHFGPAVESPELEQETSGVTMWSDKPGLYLGLFASGTLRSELLHGLQEPVVGWVSHGYGHKMSSSSLRSTLAGSAPAAALTVLAPVTTRPVVKRLSVEAGEERGNSVACSYQDGGFRDIVVSSDGHSEIGVAGFRMKGEFFWIRTDHGAVRQALAVRASLMSCHGRNLLGGPSSISCTILEDASCAASVAS